MSLSQDLHLRSDVPRDANEAETYFKIAKCLVKLGQTDKASEEISKIPSKLLSVPMLMQQAHLISEIQGT